MTNGEKLLKVFPNMKINEKMHKGIQIDFDSDWWNAEYKELTIQECQAESDKFDAAFHDGYNHGYAQARFDCEQESTIKDNLVVREFEGIEVTYPPEEVCMYSEYKGKPYFAIKYKENGEEIVGYGTYNPKVLSQYLKDYFVSTNKNDLGVDCISRDSALKALDYDIKSFKFKSGISEHMDDIAKLLDTIYKIQENNIKDLPSVTPQQRWIPVSERLPEEDTDVLVTLKCGLIGIMQKKLADDDNGESCYIWQDFEGEEHEVIAWMPLPKPYREVEE